MRVSIPSMAAGAAVFIVGCAIEDAEEAGALEPARQMARLDAGVVAAPADQARGPIVVRGPDGRPMFEASFYGTGCAPGQATLRLLADGETLVAMFTEYQAALDRRNPAGRHATGVCYLTLHPLDPSRRFAISEARMRAFVYLDREFRGSLYLQHYVMNEPDRPAERQLTVEGPYDDHALLEDVVASDALQWTGCSARSQQVVRTRIAVRRVRDSDAGVGYVAMGSVGRLGGWVRLKLVTRPCDASAPDASL